MVLRTITRIVTCALICALHRRALLTAYPFLLEFVVCVEKLIR